ncbi:MAG: 2-phospho-L-lactate transferase, partial [Spirochaetes bacterium]|nr:2-phospho-L-lactate transferase [Spirochaetota bacterium]
DVSSLGVAGCYEDFLDVLVIDEQDGAVEGDFPMRTVKYDTMMTSVEKSEALAKYIIDIL